MGNIGILILGAVLIVGVLFIGYKMDTAAEKAPKMKAPKKPKAQKKKVKVKEEYVEEPVEESYDEFPTDLSDDNTDYTEEAYESDDNIEPEDLVEESEYEDEDVSLFSSSDDVESTFNNDIDNELSFETEEPEVYEEPVEEIPEEKPQEVDDFSSTMIFDTDKLNGELEEIDKMDDLNAMLDMVGDLERVGNMQSDYSESEDFTESSDYSEPEDFSEPVYDIDDKIKALDEEDYTITPETPAVEDVESEGPIKPDKDDAESFMNQLKKLQETAEADDFSGFVVDNKDTDLREAHKKYTRKKTVIPEEAQQISFIPEDTEIQEDISLGDGGMDMNFLAQMEKNLKENQKERLSKSKNKKTSKKDDK